MKKIPYGRHHITDDDLQAIAKVLQSNNLTQGPVIKAFEEAFAKYVDAKYAVAVSNGTAALHLAMMALNVNTNSKVITTPITFSASANCIRYCGGTVEFADINPNTALIDIDAVRQLLEDAPKGTYDGIIPVDFAGYPVDLEALRDLADEYGLWIVQDACHSPGGYFIDSKNQIQKCGNGAYADMAIFSFHPVKHIACGEGGIITTNDYDTYQKLRMLRTHGIAQLPEMLTKKDGDWYYEMHELGYNYRMTDIQCALGLSQLSRAEQGIERRKQIAKKYDEVFAGTTIHALRPTADIGHAYHLYVIQVDHRKQLYDDLRKENIYAQVHYIPVYLMPYYQKLGYPQGLCPNAETYYQQCLSLPMYPSLTDREQDFVIETVLKLIPCEI